jgi:hypothetical protein
MVTEREYFPAVFIFMAAFVSFPPISNLLESDLNISISGPVRFLVSWYRPVEVCTAAESPPFWIKVHAGVCVIPCLLIQVAAISCIPVNFGAANSDNIRRARRISRPAVVSAGGNINDGYTGIVENIIKGVNFAICITHVKPAMGNLASPTGVNQILSSLLGF